MGKPLLLLVTLFFGVTFLVIPPGMEPVDLFLFADQMITVQTWLYFAFEHLSLMALAFIIATEDIKYRTLVRTYFWIQVCHFVDYLLTYNSVWFHVGKFPVSMNTIGFGIFAAVVGLHWKRL